MKDGVTGPETALPPQVYALDDDPGVLQVVARLLRRAGYRVASYDSPSRFLTEAPLTPPCCLVLDVHMPEMTGLEIQEKLAGIEDPPSIVFVSGGSDVPTSVKVMKAGAIDFLQKPFSNKDLLEAVSTALRRSEALQVARRDLAEARRRLERLTPRERQVCDGVARGLKSKEIAAELGAAVKTVNVHRSRVMAKLGVRSVAALVTLIARAGGDGAPPEP
jgi:FixJ family two-component response regulator